MKFIQVATDCIFRATAHPLNGSVDRIKLLVKRLLEGRRSGRKDFVRRVYLASD